MQLYNKMHKPPELPILKMIYITLTCHTSFLTAKNVAADISEKLCDSVATKLEGKVLGTFSGKTAVQKPWFRLY